MASERKIQGFKKFSEIKGGKEDNMEEVTPGIQPEMDSSRPGLPNLPPTGSTSTTLKKGNKVERLASRRGVLPDLKTEDDKRTDDQNIDLPTEEEEEIKEGKVEFYGKVAKFPKKTKASKALNFLENVKISKNSIWYILVEKQENELQMLKYNNRQGFDLNKFVLELKTFYIKKYAKEPKLVKLIESIQVTGAQEFSTIKNIPNIEIQNGKKLIGIITEDLIKLLSK